ncbi:hypothetical protein BY458DRAFT_506782 [Sporodiniella umbellata]|nr:hypothetical protein BY458DRAFT_506782 [Sporodiniella umbellata]
MLDLINTVYESKKEVMSTVQKRANELNFAVSTKRSNGRSIYIQCIHGGVYRNTHNIQSNERKRKKTTKKTGCQWLLSASIASKKKLWIIRSVTDFNVHNHPLVEGVYKVTNSYKEEGIDDLRQHILKCAGEGEKVMNDMAQCPKQILTGCAGPREDEHIGTKFEHGEEEEDQTVVGEPTSMEMDMSVKVNTSIKRSEVRQAEKIPVH